MVIKSIYEKIKCANDLAIDHIFGLQTPIIKEIKEIIQNEFDGPTKQIFEKVETVYKPQKYNLKPPKPTKTNIMRSIH